MNLFAMEVRIASDLEMREVGGSKLLKFRGCHNRRIKGEEKPSFFSFEAWAGGAERIQEYFKKGDVIQLRGSIYVDEWPDKATGKKQSQTIFRVEHFDFPTGGNKKQDGETADRGGDVPSYGKKPHSKRQPVTAGGDEVDRIDDRYEEDKDSIPF